jgi:curved DNA-binding protein
MATSRQQAVSVAGSAPALYLGPTLKDPYSALGVKKDASAEEIKSAYRKLARKHHPDVNPGDKKAEDRFKEVSAAHDILGDPKRRALYDEFGAEGLREGFEPERARAAKRWASHGGRAAGPEMGEASPLDDLFGEFFGGSARAKRPRRGADAEAHIEIDLVTALRGGDVPITLRSPEGARKLTVKIPAGLEDGARIRLQGQGSPGPAGAGDLYVEISVRTHPHLRREGNTLHLSVPITIGEAVNGAKVTVPTLTASVVLTVPPKSSTGTQLRLKGKGVAGGDMIVTLQIQAPDDGSDETAELARKIDAHYRQDPRKALRL